MKFRREVVAAFAAVALAACSAAAAVSPDADPSDSLPSTVPGVGNLPAPFESESVPRAAATDEPRTTETDETDETDATDGDGGESPDSSGPSTTRPRRTTTTTTDVPFRTLGEQVTGNRVLMIGDSILASTSRRYGNNMCPALVPLGWVVEVEAEVSREVTFGNTVLRSRLSAGWDAAVILLGNNYGKDPNLFLRELDKMLAALAPRPVLLLTVTEFESIQTEVNAIIRSVAEVYPNVTLVDWAALSTVPGVLSDDNLHLTDDGREYLAQQLVPYFGTAPVQPGDCLASKFHDDSAGNVNGPNTTVKPRGNRPTSTTVKPTSTTVRPGSVTTTTVRPPTTNAPTTTTPYDANPPSTVPQVTVPPITSPPTQPTQPPQTSPPQTSPPPVTLPPVGP